MVLKANNVDGDQATNIMTATGNAEVSKGGSVIYADKMIYDKDNGLIRAIGNVYVKNIEVGNLLALRLEMDDDFARGKFFNGKIILNDGSYLSSPQIERRSPIITVLKNPIYSICPNPDIEENYELAGKKRDVISIKSRETTIDRGDEMTRSKGGVIRIYDIPVFYTPFIQSPLPARKRQSGFLAPYYTKSTNLGLGIRTPYYTNIAPHMDLVTTPFFAIDSAQKMIANDFRHETAYGEYNVDLNLANNQLKTNSTTLNSANKATKEYRFGLLSKGLFDFTKNSGLDFAINNVGDRNYYRDYNFNYVGYTVSRVNLDYIHGRDYHAIKTIRIQELEFPTAEKSAVTALPELDSYIESKPRLFNERFSLSSNAVSLMRVDGLQYRRASLTPEVNLPLNFQGNLFNVDSKFQGDFYSVENNFKHQERNNNYDNVATTYKPEISLNWKLPLIKKNRSSAFMFEPMANFVASSYKTDVGKLPNEDSNSSELTISNLFVTDRIAGFDRNEAGERISYGAKTSLFNYYGEFGLIAGQSYKRSEEVQDVAIRGFAEDNKSSVVGQASYVAQKYFSIIYSFQLDQSDYRNDVNQVSSSFNSEYFTASVGYLLLRKSKQNPNEIEQASISSKVNITKKVQLSATISKDIARDRIISRSYGINRSGCCVTFGISVVEMNPSDQLRPQKTYNVTLSFKNL